MDGMCVPNDEERPNHSEPHTNNSLQKMLEAGERLGESIQQAREQERATQSHEQTMLEKEVEHQMRYDNDSLYRAAYDKVMERKAAESAPKPANPKTSPKPAYNGAAIFSVIVIFAGIAAVSMIATN